MVLGGVSSGKSRFAEGLVTQSGLAQHYIATAQAFDAEMAAKIAKHQQDRGENWVTTEAPLTLTEAFDTIPENAAILVDCLTLWLSNMMLNDPETIFTFDALVTKMRSHSGPVVCVSNEVGLSGVPENALARRFQRLQGDLNQRVAEAADLVVLVTAGLPLVLKGTSPQGQP